MPLRVFPDVLVYIMERAGRREADSQPPRTRLCVNPVLTSIHVVSMQKCQRVHHVWVRFFYFIFFKLAQRICFLIIPLVLEFLAAKLIYSE